MINSVILLAAKRCSRKLEVSSNDLGRFWSETTPLKRHPNPKGASYVTECRDLKVNRTTGRLHQIQTICWELSAPCPGDDLRLKLAIR